MDHSPMVSPASMVQRKRNKKVAVSVVMICSPIRGTLEGAIASWTTSYASLSRRSLSAARGDQAGHDHQLRSAVSHNHCRAGPAPCRTDSAAGASTKHSISRTISLACPGNAWLPHLWEPAQEKWV